MTVFSWLQNCAIDRDDSFMSDGRVFHSICSSLIRLN